MKLNDSVEVIKGVGKKRASYLARLNIRTIRQLLSHYPIRYENKKKIYSIRTLKQKDCKGTIVGRVSNISFKNNYSKKSILTVDVADDEEIIKVVYFNQPYLKQVFKVNAQYYFYGKIDEGSMVHPEFIHINSKKKHSFLTIEPVYSVTEGLKNGVLCRMMRQVLDQVSLKESLHSDIIERNQLCPYSFAIKNIHFPSSKKSFKISKYRLIFEEFFNLQIGLIFLKSDFNQEKGVMLHFDNRIKHFIDALPFELTEAQHRVIEEIFVDLLDERAMNRVLQGDVGSGKTIVAVISLILNALNGYQSAFMAPTEILAKQHYQKIVEYVKDFQEISVELLVSGTRKKADVYKRLKSGTIDIIVGTHALIQKEVYFDNLGLIITDEQHRFGVKQRQELTKKTSNTPNVLIMSATPIPRTLSMTIYGDLEVSTIDELPGGRKKVSTYFVPQRKKIEMYEFIYQFLKNGRQAYFVCPLIEDNEDLELKSTEALYKELQSSILGQFSIQMINGRLSDKEKERIMHKFQQKEIDILVSTTVIEVGIDVSNANIMVIENVERFGLAQLHQLRGRVGRGVHQSYCFLLSDRLGETAKKRVEIMVKSNDGFEISRKDLELRGPGEMFGFKQHGIPEFKLANIVKHNEILIKAQKEVKNIIEIYNKKKNQEVIGFLKDKSKEILESYIST